MFRYLLCAVLLICSAVPAHAETEKYSVVLFAYQDEANRMSNSHTFATFVKETTVNGKPVLEQRTISWIPADYAEVLTIDHVKTVTGKNFTLDETLSAVARANAKFRDSGDPTRLEVKSYGAYPLTKENYDLALERVKELESGKIKYKMIDNWSRNREKNEAVNCIHAVSDIIGNLGTGTSRGFGATEKVRDHFKAFGFFKSNDENRALVDLLMKSTRDGAIVDNAPTPGLSTHQD